MREQLILSTIQLLEIKVACAEALEEVLEKQKTQSAEQSSDLLTRKEAAKKLRITLPTLSDWSKRGIVKSYRIGNRVLYKESEIIESLKQVESFKHKRGY